MPDDPVNQIERLLNNFGAELTAQKVILQLLISQILMLAPDRCEETLAQLKEGALGSLRRTPSNPTNSSVEEQRMRNLSEQHVEDFFRLVSEAVSTMRNKLGQSGHH